MKHKNHKIQRLIRESEREQIQEQKIEEDQSSKKTYQKPQGLRSGWRGGERKTLKWGAAAAK